MGVFLGEGGGKFQAVRTYSAGNDSVPYAAEVGNFNNDSFLDIAVVDHKQGRVGILLGYGNGSFSTVQVYSTGAKSGTYAVAVGHFNDDGYLDFVVTNYNNDNIGIFLGYGNGTFADQKIFSLPALTAPVDVLVADFNHDNQLDIVTTNWNDGSVGIFIGYGNGSFAAPKTYTAGPGTTPGFMSINDLNYDGELDIAVINYGTNSFVVFFGFGDGSFLLSKAILDG